MKKVLFLFRYLIMTNKPSYVILIMCFTSSMFWEVNAQSFKCGTDKQMELMYKHNANALLESNILRKKVSRFKKSKIAEPYVIPVVFHVFGTEFNRGSTVTPAIIKDALQRTNEDFKGLNADYTTIDAPFDAIKQPFDITFKLAQLDPNGNPTTGIVFYDEASGMGNYSSPIVPRVAWDNYKYCNIYITRDLYGNGVFNSSGVAWYPNTGMSNENIARIVYNGSYLGSNTNENFRSVLTHEFGHWLDLPHTFDRAICNNDPDDGDGIADTPSHKEHSAETDCQVIQNCLNQEINNENFMDYTDCYKMFTQGQVARMNNALENSPARNTLWTDENLIATGLAQSQTDTDSDGVFDNIDTCPNTPTGETVNENGCSISQTDADGDGVFDNIDTCPNTPTGETVNASGCSAAQTDTDGDGIFDNIDQCNSTPSGDTTNAVGCVKLSPNNFEISSTTPKCPNVNNGKISIKNISSYMFNFVVTGPNSYNSTFENKLANEPFVIEGLAVGTYNVISKFSADGIGEDITGFQVTIKSATPVSGAKKSVNRLGKSSVFTVSGDKKYSIYVNDAFQRSETFSDEGQYEIIVDDLSVGENHIEIIPENKCRGLIEDWIIIPNSSIKFYPNPAIDLFHIGGLKSSDITVQIFTYTGQQVYNKNHKSVNGIVYFSIRDLSAGLYIVRVSGKKAGDNINFKVTKK